jgi:hypothetical protein
VKLAEFAMLVNIEKLALNLLEFLTPLGINKYFKFSLASTLFRDKMIVLTYLRK